MTTWMGAKPEKCDLCKKPLRDIFIHGLTIYARWSIMCRTCHRIYGISLRIGLGQKFDLNTLEKIVE
jgi:hypothetical protein